MLALQLLRGGKITAQTSTTIGDGSHTAEIVKSADGSQLTVTANGDLKDLTCASGDKVFSANAVGNVFVDVNGTKTSVKAGDKYVSTTSYFRAKRSYSELSIGEANKKQSKVYSFTEKAFQAPLYLFTNDLGIYTEYLFHSIQAGDTPYKVGKYSLYSLYTKDNLAQQWGDNSYFRILKDGETGDANANNTKVLTAQELEDDGFVTYETATTLTGLADNVYKSTDGKTYTAVSNGDVFDANATYYEGGEATYEEVANVDSYLEGVSVSFAEYLPTLMEGVTSAKFTSVDSKNPSLIDNSIIQALMNTQVRILNLSGVKIPEIVTPYTSDNYSTINTNGTFIMGPSKPYELNQYIETLYTPQVNSGGELKWHVFARLYKLRYLYLSEGIETLGEQAFPCDEGCKLSGLTFPNSLKYIKKEACADHHSDKANNTVYNEETGKYDDKEVPWIETLVFPAGLKEIESYAFGRTCPKDIYFLGTEAPKVGKHAFADNGYLGNNSFNPTVTEGNGKHLVEVNVADGAAVQANYRTKSGWIMMLHYPRQCTQAQAAKYTDITRSYKRIDYDTEHHQPGYYTPGKEKKDLKGDTNATTNIVAVKQFTNPNTMVEKAYGNNYNGGYYDYYTQEQYLWPSSDMFYRATVVAQNNVLWDGVTSIGDGIRNAGDASYTGDGSEYIGLHQFSLVKADADATSNTEEFPLDKYADGKWHSICLPFNMTKGQMKKVFGRAKDDVNGTYDNIRLCRFSDVIRVTAGDNKHLKLCFNDEQFHKEGLTDDDVVLKAHVSYMIKAKKENAVEGEKVVMSGYQMEPGAPIPTQIYASETGGSQPSDDEDNFSYRFIGTYMSNICMPQYSYFFSKAKNIFRFQGGTTGKWNPYTAVVQAPLGDEDNQIFFRGNGDNNNAKMFTGLNEMADNPTGVNQITIEIDGGKVQNNGYIYNLNGQLVSRHGIDHLQKGIYIANGKKVLVK